LCSAPRRFQDGLPVFKSFDGFSDFAGVRSPRVVAPARLRAPRLTRVALQAQAGKAEKTGKPGKCPFDCWCCF
jgi:hypothetical protein